MTVLLAILLGVLLGLLSGGGSMIAVPVFRYGMDKEPEVAFPGALIVVGIASLVGTILYAREKRIRWAEGSLFAVLSMVGAFAGGFLSGLLPGGHMVIFAVILVFTGWKLITTRTRDLKPVEGEHIDQRRLVLTALGLGALTGFLAIGGGFLVVSALVLLMRLEVKDAIATSLLVITVNAFAGLFGHLSHHSLPWGELLGVAGLASIGVAFGVAMSRRLPTQRLRDALGWIVLIVAVWVLVGEAMQ